MKSLWMSAAIMILVYGLPVSAETPVGQNAIQVQSAMDDEGNLHVVYTTSNFGAVYYMKYNGSSWIGPSYLPGSGQTWVPFSYPDIAVGPDGRAQIVYGNKTGDWPHDFDNFFYAKATDVNGTGWDVTTIGNDGKRRAYYDIAVDEYNQPHIVYEMTGTNDSPPFTSAITYRAPDGTETNLVWYPDDAIEAKNPCITYGNGEVHIAWFAGGLSIYRNELYYGHGHSQNFETWQITYNDHGTFDYPPEIGINPVTGEVIVTYLSSHWEGFEGGITGVFWVNPYGGSGTIDGEFIGLLELEWEDQAPQIGFTNDGTRYVSYSFISRNKCLYKIGDDSADRVEISPYGFIDIAAGTSAYYIRPHTPLPSPPDIPSPGPLYFEQLPGGAPPNQAPVVDFGFTPETGDYQTEFSFDASASYDPDGDTPLIYRWDWESDGTFDLELSDNSSAAYTFGYPSTYTVTLEVEDSRGARGTISHDVPVSNYEPTAVFAYTQMESLIVLLDASQSSDTEDGTDLTYSWDYLGNGIFSRPTGEDSSLYQYAEPGSYEVTLRVEDQTDGVDDTTMTVVVVGPIPDPPDSLVALDIPDDQGGAIEISWSLSPDDTSRDVHAYVLRRHPAGEPEYIEMIMPAGMNTFLDSVPTGEAYDYELAAFDSTWMEYSEWIATDSSATAWDNIAPEQIADFEATLENLDEGWRIVLHWTPSSSSDLLTQTIYRSVNGGDWNGLATLQPTATTFQDTITEIGSYFYQVRSTDGWNITVSDSVGVEVAGSDVFVGLPQTLMLTGVSPNPAKSTLTVHFGIPSAGNVEFILHDLHGRRVAETTIPCQRSGWFDIPVDLSSLSGRELTSGTFMVQLSYGSQRSTTPLVIVR